MAPDPRPQHAGTRKRSDRAALEFSDGRQHGDHQLAGRNVEQTVNLSSGRIRKPTHDEVTLWQRTAATRERSNAGSD
jgi:hypothetical protein